jgi:hypothetical protein
MSTTHTPETDGTDGQTTSDAIPEEVVDTVEQAGDRLKAEGEPVTMGRLAGTTAKIGVGNHRFETIARACREYIKNHADTEVQTEVVR